MAMFESLSKRLEGIFSSLDGQGKLTEEDVDAALREVRIALIEADVNLKVARQFVERVKQKAIGANVTGSLSPAQPPSARWRTGHRRGAGFGPRRHCSPSAAAR